MDEASAIHGKRMAWLSMLRHCLRELVAVWTVEDDEVIQLAQRIAEREEAIQVLKRLCETHGDMDWNEHLHLADILDKHLGRHLDEREG